ncbi:hypothetical protein HYFRA_00005045 [Hymenoscyphus fraxineus]|uniref:Uncharacterized protein n=1 Tax=Hymenoscyphus fraxineus TaxID=746836 RepID=A0A9N9PK41_9HELO|nr:hypothetical protein HYFRA_00005045 [Hymenoscyphus fraxineus]
METSPLLPRITIQFCTQCKWMLRAAYFAQELLSTFGTSLGEVALQPSTGGTFIVHLYHGAPASNGELSVTVQKTLLWDRKAEGGFPETKELKKRVRDVIDPSRNLGHVDGHKKSITPQPTKQVSPFPTPQPLPSPLSPLAPNDQLQSTNPLDALPSQASENSVPQIEGLNLNHNEGVSTKVVEDVKPDNAGKAKDGEKEKECEDCM